MLQGIAVSPGVVVGPAFCLNRAVADQPRRLDEASLAVQMQRLEHARAATAAELALLAEQVADEIGPDEAAIFQAHLMMVGDPELTERIRRLLARDGVDAATALDLAVIEYERLFDGAGSDHLNDRVVDLRDVTGRIKAHLLGERLADDLPDGEPFILVARELLPSQTARLDRDRVAGILTERGGTTGHSAVLARALGIPAVSGVAGVAGKLCRGDTVILDGREGHVLVNPGREAEAAYRKLAREFVDLQGSLAANRDLPAVTADGVAVDLLANVNGLADTQAAVAAGAAGVGLFRTEYLFMTHPTIPSEDEQQRTYAAVVAAAPDGRVTIRTLDLGGDKTVGYFGAAGEANPFMGLRSIRLSFEHPEFFAKQLRAVLRAATGGAVRLMFPMIATLAEVRRCKALVRRTVAELATAGHEFARELPVGMMLEVPAALWSLEDLLAEVDFVCVGTNDLVQYLYAADRDNPKVTHLCDPLGPAHLRALRHVARLCRSAAVPVTVCGEMAGQPRCILALLAFGFRSFSTSPALVPVVKELVRTVRLDGLADLTDRLAACPTAAQVRELLDATLHRLAPRLETMDLGWAKRTPEQRPRR